MQGVLQRAHARKPSTRTRAPWLYAARCKRALHVCRPGAHTKAPRSGHPPTHHQDLHSDLRACTKEGVPVLLGSTRAQAKHVSENQECRLNLVQLRNDGRRMREVYTQFEQRARRWQQEHQDTLRKMQSG